MLLCLFCICFVSVSCCWIVDNDCAHRIKWELNLLAALSVTSMVVFVHMFLCGAFVCFELACIFSCKLCNNYNAVVADVLFSLRNFRQPITWTLRVCWTWPAKLLQTWSRGRLQRRSARPSTSRMTSLPMKKRRFGERTNGHSSEGLKWRRLGN